MECSVGLFVSEHCHKHEYQSFSKTILQVSDLSDNEQLLLKLRVSKEVENICQYHKYKYLNKYHHIFGRNCCDPLQYHKKPIRNGNVEM